jgi:signal transduction histidine kinase
LKEEKLERGANLRFMSIRMKLLLSYAAMLVVPLILILLISLLLVLVFRGDLQNMKSIYEYTEDAFDHEDYYRLTNEIKRTMIQNPSLAADPDYLNEISDEIRKTNSGLVVRTDGRISYTSDLLAQKQDLTSNLPSFRHDSFRQQDPAQRYGAELYMINQLDLQSKDRLQSSIFILTKVNPFAYYARKYFPFLFLAMIVILVLTHALLTYFMSKHIIRPLQLLRKGARQIKEGNLDFHVDLKGKDEIGQLGVAYEEMRHQLQQSIKLQLQYEENRKELISNISHDLKTPITAIRGYVDGILDGVADSPEKTGKYMKTISAKAEEMDQLIDELFLYSKLDLKRLPFTFEPVGMYGFLTDWAEELQFELEKKQIRLEADIRLAPVLEVSMDRDKFKRVLGNIIENSVKYMDKANKHIRLRAFDARNTIYLEISDNGRGIDSEALPHIFERFYRAEQSRNAATGGSGLGLAIASQIMEGHGGGIHAESTHGEGTTISVTFPILTKE